MTRIACHARGQGDPVLCLHSGGFSSRQWKRLAEALAPTHRVLLPDLIGYGASDPLPDGAPFDFHDDLDALVEVLADEPPLHVVGHSYGGMLALHLALRRPVRSLALYEPVAFSVLVDRTGLDLDLASYDGEPWLATFIDWWQGPGAWSQMAPEARAGFLAVGWKVFREVASLTVDRTDYSAIRVPALLLGGGRTPAPEQRTLAALAPIIGAELRMFPELGHMGPITHAAQVNGAIVDHIALHSASMMPSRT